MKRVYIGLIINDDAVVIIFTHHKSSDIYPVVCIVYV
jgi:hypothetical protein